jgi:uncharacterized protein YhaN
LQEEAEEAKAKWKSEEAEKKRKADEAKAQRVEAARKAAEAEKVQKAEEAERAKAAKDKAEKEEAEKIRAANEAMKAGVAANLAEVKRVAKLRAAANEAAALATRQRNLAKIGVRPDDCLMLIPEGPWPSREEVRNIRKQVAGQARKRKIGDTEASVHFFRSLASDELT